MWTDDDDGRTTPDHWYTLSSPEGSGELNQRTNGTVNAHLISWPSKAQNIQNLEIYGKEMTLTFNTHLPS